MIDSTNAKYGPKTVMFIFFNSNTEVSSTDSDDRSSLYNTEKHQQTKQSVQH